MERDRRVGYHPQIRHLAKDSCLATKRRWKLEHKNVGSFEDGPILRLAALAETRNRSDPISYDMSSLVAEVITGEEGLQGPNIGVKVQDKVSPLPGWSGSV